jgi:hypothetical protein
LSFDAVIPGGATFSAPGHPFTTGLFVLACALVVIATVVSNPLNSAIGYMDPARRHPRLPLLAAQEQGPA